MWTMTIQLSLGIMQSDYTNTFDKLVPELYSAGYFTSRPALKGYVREMNNLLQVCTQMEALGLGTSKKLSTHTSMALSKCNCIIK